MVKKGNKVKVLVVLANGYKICQVSERDYKSGKVTGSGIFLYKNGRKLTTRYKNQTEADNAATILINKK